MPIGDLLAEISGEKSSPAPSNLKISTSAGIKRKADNDPNGIPNGIPNKVSKIRQANGSYATSSVARNTDGDAKQSLSASRNALSIKPTTPSSRITATAKPSSSTASNQRPAATSSSSSDSRPYTGTATPGRLNGRPSPLPSTTLKGDKPALAARPKPNSSVPSAKPSPTTPTLLDPSKAPKKGSFAEIMARGAKAQQIMPKAGVIQHKPVPKLTHKQRNERIKGKLGSSTGKARSATGQGSKGPRPSTASRDGPKNGMSKDSKANGRSRPNSSGSDAPEKKLKKAALATTGYTGTARPPPASSAAKKSSASRNSQFSASSRTAGGLLAPPKAKSRGRFEEEYDDELDDFIVDDEDHDDGPQPGGYSREYDYASDASSDMEAGLSDIDVEERKAEYIAREEDRREKALEEKLKREKEERKRRLGIP
ncbi:uncharacterized protein BCR38DRAFT_437914 [Pseudomassariella vexata]|uniref:SPT2 chromatin protein-domain-containing protein n=1 Tax=Pseudomassariella vexata TaxID=1141098 RepID=A0A1Y2DSH3_9PEZI|nr:uncharacterized protein BCR38DRAFT_437914 [Pseudomassariella vexata]ORY62233.1 hypothetical protein BCR38DRAFT_437914 [Pseudomassariella vexata]